MTWDIEDEGIAMGCIYNYLNSTITRSSISAPLKHLASHLSFP